MNIQGFEFPEDHFYWLENDMWAALEPNGLVKVGITPFGVHLSGSFFMCRPKAVGTLVDQGATMGVAELNKAVVTLKSPISGQITQVNPLLLETPEIIERDPYGAGWLAVMQPTRWAQDLTRLAHGAALQAALIRRLQLERLKPQDEPPLAEP